MMIKLNTKNVKEIGKWMMIFGGGLFTCGAGMNFVCNRIESKEAKTAHANNMMKIEEDELSTKLLLDEEAIKAAAEKDHLYSEKLRTMDEKAFAKFHADNVAKANDEVMANANRIKKDSEAEIAKIKMKCSDEMTALREECLKKVEEANKKRDEAMAKYEAIDILFTNKKEILKAKEALEEAVAKDQKAKDSREELLKNIQDILQ